MMYAILFLIGLMSQSNVSVKNTSCDIGISNFAHYIKTFEENRINQTMIVIARKRYVGYARKALGDSYINGGMCLMKNDRILKCIHDYDVADCQNNANSILYNYNENNALSSVIFFPEWQCIPGFASDNERDEHVYDYRGKCPVKETLYEFPECDKDYEFIRIENIEQKCIWRDNVYYRNDRNGQMYCFATGNRKHGVSVQLKLGDIMWIDFYGVNCRQFKKYGEIKRRFSPMNQMVIWQSYRELIDRMYYIRKNFAMGPYTNGFRILPYYVDDEKVGAIY